MNHDASDKHVLSKSGEGNQNKLCKAAAAGQDTRTTHSLTRSLAVVCGKDRSTGQYTTNATCSAIHVLF